MKKPISLLIVSFALFGIYSCGSTQESESNILSQSYDDLCSDDLTYFNFSKVDSLKTTIDAITATNLDKTAIDSVLSHLGENNKYVNHIENVTTNTSDYGVDGIIDNENDFVEQSSFSYSRYDDLYLFGSKTMSKDYFDGAKDVAHKEAAYELSRNGSCAYESKISEYTKYTGEDLARTDSPYTAEKYLQSLTLVNGDDIANTIKDAYEKYYGIGTNVAELTGTKSQDSLTINLDISVSDSSHLEVYEYSLAIVDGCVSSFSFSLSPQGIVGRKYTELSSVTNYTHGSYVSINDQDRLS